MKIPIQTICVLGAAALVAACGGSSDKLSHRFPERQLAPVPPAEQAAVADALREVYLAERTEEHLDYQLDQVKTEIKVAKNDRKRANLDRDSAKLRLESAEQVADRGSADSSRKAEQGATTTRDGMTRKLAYLEARRGFLEKQREFAAKDLRAKQARYELTKAELAKKRNIQPKGFKLGQFQAQHKRRKAAANQAQQVAAAKKQNADDLEKKWRGGAAGDRASAR